jgi:hypothetical protein
MSKCIMKSVYRIHIRQLKNDDMALLHGKLACKATVHDVSAERMTNIVRVIYLVKEMGGEKKEEKKRERKREREKKERKGERGRGW